MQEAFFVSPMHMLYLDDSGSIHNTSEEYFVLAGVSVPENSVRWLSYELEKLATTIEPSAPQKVEFHAAAIFGGREGVWQRMSDRSKRIAVIQSVLRTLDNAYSDTVLFATAIHKASCTGNPVIEAYEDLSSRFNYYLRRQSYSESARSQEAEPQRGIIIMDKTSDESNLQALASTIRRDGNRWGDPQRAICEVPMFVDSKSSRIIQLADHIAYAVFRRYNAKDLTYFDCIESRFDQEDGVFHGLNHKRPKGQQFCGCPACLSRANRRSGA